MSLLGKCDDCRARGFWPRRRKYSTKHTGVITSQSDLCGRCYRRLRRIVEQIDGSV